MNYNDLIDLVMSIPTQNFRDYAKWLSMAARFYAAGLSVEDFKNWSARDPEYYDEGAAESSFKSMGKKAKETQEEAIATLRRYAEEMSGYTDGKDITHAVVDAHRKAMQEPLLVDESKGGKKPIISYGHVADYLKYNDWWSGGTIRYNDVTQEIEYDGFRTFGNPKMIAQALPHQLVCVLADEYRGVNDECMARLIADLAMENHYNPITDQLEKNKWDKKDRFELIYSALGLTDDFSKKLVKKWFVQCIAMLYNDGNYGAEGVLTLLGKQGIRKTSFFRSIVPNIKWFAEGRALDMDNKDTVLQSISYWITELGEVDSTTRKEQSSLKAFLTQYEDCYRRPYGRSAMKTPRHTSFCATVNERSFLTDTENRRWWVIEVENIDGKLLEQIKNEAWQIWYQCYAIWKEDNNYFRLNLEEQQEVSGRNSGSRKALVYEEEIEDNYNWSASPDLWIWKTKKEIRDAFEVRANDTFKFGKAFNFVVSKRKIKSKRVRGIDSYMLPPVIDEMDMAEIRHELADAEVKKESPF